MIINDVTTIQNIMKSLNSPRINTSFCFIVILLFVLFSCYNKKPDASSINSLTEFGLKGRVKSFSETDFRTKIISGEIQRGDMVSKSVYIFNENGMITEDRQYNSEGKLSWKSVFKYDYEGHLIERATYYDSLDFRNRVVYKYDNRDNLIEESKLNSKGEIEYRVNYKYNRKGHNTEKLIFRPAEKYWNISVEYDENKNIIKSSSYKISEAQVTRYFYKHDPERNRVEEVYYRPDGSRGSTYIDIFDDKGNKIESEVYGSDDSLIYKSEFRYDERGNVLERKTGAGNNKMETDQTLKYDSVGNIIEEINYSKWMISKNTYNYLSFDKEGNWLIRRIIVSSVSTGKNFSFVEREREIIYY